MSPQERQLIESVFSRLAQNANTPKDAEAQALIAQRVQAQPDAVYGLVQAVLVQENLLQQAQARINQLEQQQQQQPAGGSFLGAAPANPWSRPSPQQAQQASFASPPQYAQPQQFAQPAPWGQPAGGGFLQQAATAAVGVAGGMLLAEGVSSLFSGHHGGFGGGFQPSGLGGQPEMVENVTVNNYYGNDQAGGSVAQAVDYGSGDVDFSTGSDDSWA